jgi:hypothetical protein
MCAGEPASANGCTGNPKREVVGSTVFGGKASCKKNGIRVCQAPGTAPCLNIPAHLLSAPALKCSIICRRSGIAMRLLC